MIPVLLAMLTEAPDLRLSLKMGWGSAAVTVVLSNVGRSPVVAWAPGSSYHHDSFRFEAWANGRWEQVRRRPVEWKQNTPRVVEMLPGMEVAFEVHLADLFLPLGARLIRTLYRPVVYPTEHRDRSIKLLSKFTVRSRALRL